ncbi:MAG: right-handed parallel beta-helix repeat-containing protein, partial [Anaerolineae bacterium]|nr:right-handed parallel beta-helix repeat-containing protein [Anaerolineae bacterium]
PTEEPTVEPTEEPTVEPTVEPTAEPTQEPTVEPTQEPTQEPTPVPVPVTGMVYYVAPSGSDGGSGDSGHPWRTLQKAANTANPGDVVIVHGGTYNSTTRFTRSGTQLVGVTGVTLSEGNKVTFSGGVGGTKVGDYLYVYHSRLSNNGVYQITEVGSGYVRVAGASFRNESSGVEASIGRPVIFKAADGETVTLDPQYTDMSYSTLNIEASYLIFDGFNVTGSRHIGASFSGAHHNVVRNCDVYGNWRPGFYLIDGSTYNMIIGNEIHGNGVNGPGEGVYIGQSIYYNPNDPSYHTHVIDNHIYGITTGDEGVDIKPNVQGTVVEGNLFENNDSTWGVVRATDGTRDGLIYNNIIRNNSGSNQYAGGISINGTGFYIYNNLIVNNSGLDGIYLQQRGGNMIFHNTIIGHDVGIGFDYDGTSLSGTQIVNNLISGNDQQFAGPGSGADIRNNLVDGSTEFSGSDPLEAAPDLNSSYEPRSDSPAVDAGESVGITIDLDGDTRDGSPDIGAYER